MMRIKILCNQEVLHNSQLQQQKGLLSDIQSNGEADKVSYQRDYGKKTSNSPEISKGLHLLLFKQRY